MKPNWPAESSFKRQNLLNINNEEIFHNRKKNYEKTVSCPPFFFLKQISALFGIITHLLRFKILDFSLMNIILTEQQ